jgi:telomerase protein component 1
MTNKWRTAKIFISSTFKDMHSERDILIRQVIPELQERYFIFSNDENQIYIRCKKLFVHVMPIDLRWGVTEEETQQALEICLLELENSRPFFIGIAGTFNKITYLNIVLCSKLQIVRR